MRICLINNLYKPWNRGGAERVVEKMAAGLSRSGHEVFVIATAPEETLADDVHFIRSIFYNLGNYPLWQRFFWHIGDFFAFGRRSKVAKILALRKAELVITHNLKGVSLSLPRLLKRRSLRHFHVLHDIQLLHPSGLMHWGQERAVDSPWAKAYQAVCRYLFASPEVVISPSRWLLDEHVKRGFFKDSKKVVLPNHFKEDVFRPSTAVDRPRSAEHPFAFLFVGQLEEHKGAKFLVETFLKMLKDDPGAKVELSLAGDGRLLESLRQAAADEPRVRLLGRKSEDEVRELMLGSDCLVVPSLCYENSPTVIYEAANAHLPVLAADLGGIGELCAELGGSLFRPGDLGDLIDKMKIFSSSRPSRAVGDGASSILALDYFRELESLAKGESKV